MPKIDIPLSNGFYNSESLPVSSQLCVNMFVNIPETQGITQAQLFETGGLQELTNTGFNKFNRGAATMGGVPYFVNGNELVRLNADFTHTVLGNIAGKGLVSMAENGTQLCIVVPNTGTAYIYSVLGGLKQITDNDFTANGLAEIVVFVDGYFVFTTRSRKFFVSAINDGLSYNALDFGSAEADPDLIRSAHVHKNQLYIMGSETIEVFQNVGGIDFPFQRVTGFVISKGITSPFSVTEFAGSFVWIGAGRNESPRVYMFSGNDAVEISTTSIDFILETGKSSGNVISPFALSPDKLEQIQVFNYTYRGAQWVGWSAENGTFVYDKNASEKMGRSIWHTRRSRNIELDKRWRGTTVINAYNELLTGDVESGRIGAIRGNIYTEYGVDIDREFSLPTVFDANKPTFHHSIELIVDAGERNVLGNDFDTNITLDYSDDGRFYKHKGKRSAGKQGQYNIKLKWSQLGYTERFRIYRFSMRGPVAWSILAVALNIE